MTRKASRSSKPSSHSSANHPTPKETTGVRHTPDAAAMTPAASKTPATTKTPAISKKSVNANATNIPPATGHSASDLFDPLASGPSARGPHATLRRASVTAAHAPKAPRPATAKRSNARVANAAGASGVGPAKRASMRGKAVAAPSRRLIALDAAARVLSELSPKAAAEGLTAAALVERMAAARLWSSPGGKTPAATLYAAMIRDIAAKKGASRFQRIGKGLFGPGASTPRASSGKDATVVTKSHANKPAPKRSSGARVSE